MVGRSGPSGAGRPLETTIRDPRGGRARALAVCTVVAMAVVSVGGCTQAASQAPPATPGPAGSSAPDVVARLAPSVVTVRTPSGLGSGVVYRPDVVLTNQHVVEGATDVVVEYADGTSSPGTVTATDTVTDLGVVRTARSGLPVPEYRPDLPRPGEAVLAIGSPLGFEGTVTSGIVSGLHREIPGSAAQSRALVDLIQVDAAISPGNSGGALLDASGRVIGINEAYIPPSAGAVSIGFAIPAATVTRVADQLLADGTATHPFLGITVSPLTPAIRDRLDVRADAGALVVAVATASPAAAAGVQPGDVVVALGDRRIATVEDVFAALRDTRPGQATTLGVVRAGQRQDLPITVAEMPQPR
jgi:serine protease Do